MNTENVDAYLRDGCGRCDKYRTPECKVHPWREALSALRALLSATELTEEMKWGAPCYTLAGKNVVMLVAFKDTCALSFFKGAGLDDPDGVLQRPGPNSRIGRTLVFRSLEDVEALREPAKRLIAEAIAFERGGGALNLPPASEPMPRELADRLAADPALSSTFEALTPGRRRSHVLHVSGAKQPATRQRRVEKCAAKILVGKGFNER